MSVNNARIVLNNDFSSSKTNINLPAGTGAILGDDFPMKITYEFTDLNRNVISREILNITSRSGDTLTVQRAVEKCPVSDFTFSQTQTPVELKKGGILEVRITAGEFDGKANLSGATFTGSVKFNYSGTTNYLDNSGTGFYILPNNDYGDGKANYIGTFSSGEGHRPIILRQGGSDRLKISSRLLSKVEFDVKTGGYTSTIKGHGYFINRNNAGYLANINTDGHLRFLTGGSHPNSNCRMYIDKVGKVGFGTINPTAWVDIRHSGKVANFITTSTGDEELVALFTNSNNNKGVKIGLGEGYGNTMYISYNGNTNQMCFGKEGGNKYIYINRDSGTTGFNGALELNSLPTSASGTKVWKDSNGFLRVG